MRHCSGTSGGTFGGTFGARWKPSGFGRNDKMLAVRVNSWNIIWLGKVYRLIGNTINNNNKYNNKYNNNNNDNYNSKYN